jgi:hypothetical protein
MLIAFVVLVQCVLIVYLSVIYLIYIPGIEKAFYGKLGSSMTGHIVESITKLANGMTIFTVILITISILLIYVVYNIKKFLVDIDMTINK